MRPAHIPGAVFLDIEEVATATARSRTCCRPTHKFASRMQSLGARRRQPLRRLRQFSRCTAPRASGGCCKTFGAHHVALLDGGLQKWKAEGRPLESGREPHRHGHFTALLDDDGGGRQGAMLALVGAGSHEIVDARAGGALRRRGRRAAAGPRLGPHSRLAQPAAERAFQRRQQLEAGDALRAAFDAAGVDLAKPMVTTCGSGVTAAVLLFGAHLLGKDDVRLYDGSWSEWGADPATPKATGRGVSEERKPETRLVEAGRRKEWTAGHRQSAGLARLDHLVRQRRRDGGGQSAARRHAPLRPQRHADDLGAVRGADRARAGRGDDPALSRRARRRSPAPCSSVLEAGDELLMVDSAYGPTRALCDTRAQALRRDHASITIRWSAPGIAGADRRADPRRLHGKPRHPHASRCRTCPPSARRRKARGLVTLLDNTWATPLFFPAIAAGVDLSILACTKYIGGHADLMLGSVTVDRAVCRAARADPPRARPDRRPRRCLAGAARPAHARRPARAAPGERRSRSRAG